MKISIDILILFMLALVINAGCSQAYSEQHKTSVAVVAGEPVYVDEFRAVYIDYLFKTGLQDESAHRTRILNSLVDEYLLAQDAQKAGIEQNPNFQAVNKKHFTKLLIEAFVEKVLFDTLQISEDELKDMFIRAQTTLSARHLYSRTRKQAEVLQSRLVHGASFEELAKEVFADTALANNGGFIGEFTLDDMDLAFEEAAFTLEVGEVSEPVKTSTGYSIIKLESRFLKPLITEYEFAERRDRIMHFVTYRKKNAARKEYVSRLIEEMAPAYNAASLDHLVGQITGLAPAKGEEAWLSDRLVTYAVEGKSKTLDVAGFKELAQATSDQQRASVTDRESLIQFVDGLLAREEIIRQAKALQIDELPEFRQALERANRSWIRDFVASSKMNDLEVSEDLIEAYFDQHGDEFQQASTVRVWEILLDNKLQADNVREALHATSFEELAKRFSLRPGADEAGGDLGYLTAEQMGAMATHILSTEAGEILGPLELKGYYVLLKVGDSQRERSMSYKEARPEILKRLRQSLGKENLQRHIRDLRAQSEVYIDHVLLSELPLKEEK